MLMRHFPVLMTVSKAAVAAAVEAEVVAVEAAVVVVVAEVVAVEVAVVVEVVAEGPGRKLAYLIGGKGE